MLRLIFNNSVSFIGTLVPLVQENDAKKWEKRDSNGQQLTTASISVRALIEEKIIQKRSNSAAAAAAAAVVSGGGGGLSNAAAAASTIGSASKLNQANANAIVKSKLRLNETSSSSSSTKSKSSRLLARELILLRRRNSGYG